MNPYEVDDSAPPSAHEQVMDALRGQFLLQQQINKRLMHLEWAAAVVVLLLLFK